MEKHATSCIGGVWNYRLEIFFSFVFTKFLWNLGLFFLENDSQVITSLGFLWWIISFKLPFKFLIGFNSGYWLGHWSPSTLFGTNHSRVTLALCFGSLSLFKLHEGFWWCQKFSTSIDLIAQTAIFNILLNYVSILFD